MFHLARTAIIAFAFLASPAFADWFTVDVRTASSQPIAGVTVCPVVLETSRRLLPAVQLINGARLTTNQYGYATFDEPFDGSTRLFFEGRIRFLVFADGYCPAACDVDFYWSHNPSSPHSVPEDYSCWLNMQWAENGSYGCRQGRTNTTNLMNLDNTFVNESGAYIRIADIDGELQSHFGMPRVGYDHCPSQREISIPVVPDIVPTNPVISRPAIPTSPIDPNANRPVVPRQ